MLFSSNFSFDICRFPAHFRRFSGISFEPNLQFSDRCIISFFPDHFKWLTGTVPQFVAVLQERNLDFLSKKNDEAPGREVGEHDMERTILIMSKRLLL